MGTWIAALLHILKMGAGTAVAAQTAWKTQAAAGRPTGGQSVTGRPPNP